MSEYSFRLAALADKALICDFMQANWGSPHPLICNENLFNYYYVTDTTLQFALCEQNGELVAISGYILANNSPSPDVWVSIWCAKKGYNGAGLELMNYLPVLTNSRVMACNNIREKTMPFYTFLGYTAARLPHYYRLANKNAYSVAKIVDKNILALAQGPLLCKIETAQELANIYTPNESLRPYKDLWYLTRRYFNYPYQKYNVWRLLPDANPKALLVTRTVDVNNTKVLRIVDYIGKPTDFDKMGYGINALINSENAEYADMYCYGISKDVIANAGFCERTPDSKNIIPNYLTPPIYENTEYFFFTQNSENFTMFKADGDQDRANIDC